MPPRPPSPTHDQYVHVRGAREHNLKNIDVQIPRDALVVFTGISGSGKSSLAFGTLYAEAQRRYLESVSPYARRLFHQLTTPDVDEITGLPPAVALQQQRGSPTTRSSVGSVTTLSNLLRMLYSRAGDYPKNQPLLYAESFSPNTPQGACPKCHGLGRIYDVTEASMVPDPNKTIRDRAIAAWPLAWGGQNQRDILVSMGIDVDIPWKDLPKKTRDWILFTEERPEVPVYPGYTPAETRRAIKRGETPNYMGTFVGARRYVLETFATTESALMKRRVAQFMTGADCPECHGKRLRPESLSVKFANLDITDISRLPLKALAKLIAPYTRLPNPAQPSPSKASRPAAAPPRASNAKAPSYDDHTAFPSPEVRANWAEHLRDHPAKAEVAHTIAVDLHSRLTTLLDLGLGYLTLERSTPTLSPGELQRLRLATQVRSNLFGVVYVLDEPCAGLHPADTESLLRALDQLKHSGNTLFVVEHDLDVIRHADWLVDVGPNAGQHGGKILYSGPPDGLKQIEESHTARHLFPSSVHRSAFSVQRSSSPRQPRAWLKLDHITRNNLHNLSASFPLGVMTSVTGVSGSGKSTLVSQVLVTLVAEHLGHPAPTDDDTPQSDSPAPDLERAPAAPVQGRITAGMEHIKRLVTVDQKPIGRTPRSNLATYTGLFDHVRKLFAATKQAKSRHYDAGRFSFNVKTGRCPHCNGEGFVMVELLFLPSVYTPCPTCHGARYNPKTLEVTYHEKNIAQVLDMTVDAAHAFFSQHPADDSSHTTPILHALATLQEVGLGYLRLGQPATELSGGEAQRIKLATELQRPQRGHSLYVLDEPTTGLHPHDVEKLLTQLHRLVDAGNTVILVEHDMHVVASSDWTIDIGPGAGDEGGQIICSCPPADLAKHPTSRTAPYLARHLAHQA